ncbi:TNT domain-containing protein [Actinophytocola sp. NPDC049390]|uniref:TNT domain-containing protein n=1 Tax=Actinophytocola sp. NPDC049390 TaxID=3363894 RepID=UPI0037A120A0
MRRIAALLAGLLTLTFVLAPPAQAAPVSLTECSAELYAGDARLGPAELPKLGAVGVQLVGYSRTGHRSVDVFLDRYYDEDAGSWRYPPDDGYATGPDGAPVKWVQTLASGWLIDRYGSEYGAFLAPAGLPYTTRSIPPSNLVGTPAAGCNYYRYQVLRPFDVQAGPIAPWFFQTGGGLQYQLSGALVPGAPDRLSVRWLVDNGYLGRVSSPST